MSRPSRRQATLSKSTPEAGAKSKSKPSKQPEPWQSKAKKIVIWPFVSIRRRVRDLKSRRPHRSFRRTRRRDYQRSLKLPGYWAFTLSVVRTLCQRKALWLLMAFTYGSLVVLLGGMTSQDTYRTIADVFDNSIGEAMSGSWGKLSQAGLLSVAAFTGNSNSLSEVQQVYLGIVLLLTWLTTVWLLREILAGRRPKLRDGLYSSSAPLLSTLLVAIIFLVQLLPVGITALVYAALSGVGLVNEGFGAMIFFAIAALIAALTLYWLTATFIALVVVTLPGMYPLQAIKAAGDLVVGRRLRIMYRLLWLALTVIVVWFVIMIPLILLDSWLSGIWQWFKMVPLVPIVAVVMSSLTVIYVASYIYLMYRKVVADDAAPA